MIINYVTILCDLSDIRMSKWRQQGTLLSLLLFTASSLSASVSIVSDNGEVLPIEKLSQAAANSPAYTTSIPKTTNQQTQRSRVTPADIIQKYGSIENAIYNLPELTPSEQETLRVMALEDMKRQHALMEQEKTEAKVEAIQRAIGNDNAVYKATNNPTQIVERRKTNSEIKKARKTEIHKPTVNMTSETFEPELNGLVTVNTAVNRPTALSFFDQMGNPYPVVKYLPETATDFKFETYNENVLIISANDNYGSLSGFVFLKNINQPIPVMYTANPENQVDVKKNILVPQTSPTAETSYENAMMTFASVTRDDDPAMFAFLNGRTVSGSRLITIDGLPARSRAWKYKDYVYIKTTGHLKYDMVDAKRSGDWKIFKAIPRESYWVTINGRETEVFVRD